MARIGQYRFPHAPGRPYSPGGSISAKDAKLFSEKNLRGFGVAFSKWVGVWGGSGTKKPQLRG